MVRKKGKWFPAILQSFDMCDKSASLDGKGKSFRRPFIPASKDLFLGQAVKRDVLFDLVKMFSIEFEPFSLREIGGIKDLIPPMGIIVTAGTNENHISNFRLHLPAGRQGFRISD